MDCTEIISVVTVPLNKRLATWQILSTVVTFSCAALGFSPLSPHSLHLIWGHRFSNKTELDSIFISDKLGWQTGFQLILGDIFDLSWTIRLHAGLYRDNPGWSGSLRQRASYLRDPGHSCNIDGSCSVDFHPLDRRDFLASFWVRAIEFQTRPKPPKGLPELGPELFPLQHIDEEIDGRVEDWRQVGYWDEAVDDIGRAE